MSLMNTALSGLRAAQIGLNTTSNNIANVNTEGYNRQLVNLSEGRGSYAGGLFSGSGVNVDGVQRQYQQYLSTQLNQAQSDQSASRSHLDQLQQVNNLLADDEGGLNTQIQSFFAGMQTLADNPGDISARQAMLGNAESMTSQFRATDNYLKNMDSNTTAQMGGTLDEINSLAGRIAELNGQINSTRAKTGTEPNDMLDQRDLAVSKLSQLTGISVYSQDGKYNVSMSSGETLVAGNRAQSLEMTASQADPTRQVVAFRNADGNLSEVSEKKLSGGELGGLMAFRNKTLPDAQHRLDQLAHALGSRINELQTGGVDLNGNAGNALFTTSEPAVTADSRNQGEGQPAVSFSGDIENVGTSNYRLTVDNSVDAGYRLERLSDGQSVSAEEAGLEIDVEGLNDGDRFNIKPLEGAAADLGVSESMTPEGVAARSNERDADGNLVEGRTGNSNARAMADVQSETLIGGSASLNTAYASLVGEVGNRTATLESSNETQSAISQEIKSAQQSVSGVNLDEEAANMMRYQQFYSANAQMIRASSETFNTLLGIMR
ncbi:flagellar hook-associated protein FlgK [Kushneria aurantia]|uniref:Flagellar hook-associated protein 1 n=1 Tax=Kushneria aurantia TaxID=504092 RepID=A0ABV6G102_9GAMM|nr:flagellar hook-associated protein FlgK [Kushneria aurantia]